MEKFDDSYDLLKDMYMDTYYPEPLVDEIYDLMFRLINILEEGERDKIIIQQHLDEMTRGINQLQKEFIKQESDLESVARDCIAQSLQFILKFFTIDIDLETALSLREW